MSSCLDENVCLQVHSHTIKAGYERCTAVNNAAMAMYINHGHLKAASKLFEKLEEKDIVAWNTMITGYAQKSFARRAILNYMQMQRAGFRPDEYTIGSLLASTECLGTVHMFQAVVLKSGLELISEATNALISAFSKHGGIKKAYQIFCESFPKNLISWNAIISGFLFNGCPMQAIEQFSDLLNANIRPDVYTLNIALSCCSSLSALRHGKQVHGYILKFGFFQETFLGNSLISMYAKCGFLNWSKKVFNGMNERDIISWNAIISALGQFGEGKKAVQTFSTMKVESRIVPDHGTFMAVLSACSRAGLVDDGISIFYSMVKDCGFEPAIDHFACVVDLLGRAGYLDEAERLIEGKDIEIDSAVWWALFSACAAYGNIRLGRIVAGFLLKTEWNNPTIYVLLSNIHAAAGQWEEAADVRELMKRIGVLKHPGCTWIRS
ncbi:hypothetical protein Nepgr_016709 [Nepenthes gracilis]|uniref:Pentatricopeptide repeat-containing protein n=1 Tax=Nepenthes gracilis TaxID=150966 RepID=A0AAD3SN62_NEPGR|nr:hypothetical protein Nepgr_016709 [Nepenthes gracilis]